MSSRVFIAVLAALLFANLTGSLRAEEQQAEAEVDLKAMLQRVEKLVQERKANSSVQGVAYPFGHFLVVAAPTPKAAPAPEKVQERAPAGMPDFSITGKMKMGRQLKIFVGRGAYGVGETVDGAKIVEIKNDEAVFEFGGTTYKKPIP